MNNLFLVLVVIAVVLVFTVIWYASFLIFPDCDYLAFLGKPGFCL